MTIIKTRWVKVMIKTHRKIFPGEYGMIKTQVY